jgi:hypothetical protein
MQWQADILTGHWQRCCGKVDDLNSLLLKFRVPPHN